MTHLRVLYGSIAAAAIAVVTSLTAAPAGAVSTGAQLEAARQALDASLTVPGTAFALDPATRTIVVSADSTVTGAKMTAVRRAVSALGGAVTVKQVAGTFTTRLRGGDAVYGGGYVCSAGFNVRSGSTYYFLTAGHCTDVASTWYADSRSTSRLGSTTGSSFPSNDYGIVKYATGVAHPGTVNRYNGTTVDITRAATPVVGATVYRAGRTTGLKSGRVTALDATVNYPEGRVSGLIQTTVCAEGGDSGGPLFSNGVAYGLTSGGNGDCTRGGTTFFQPVTEVLAAYGVSVY